MSRPKLRTLLQPIVSVGMFLTMLATIIIIWLLWNADLGRSQTSLITSENSILRNAEFIRQYITHKKDIDTLLESADSLVFSEELRTNLRNDMREITGQTIQPGDKAQAEKMRDKLLSFGIPRVEIEEIDTLLNEPLEVEVSLSLPHIKFTSMLLEPFKEAERPSDHNSKCWIFSTYASYRMSLFLKILGQLPKTSV